MSQRTNLELKGLKRHMNLELERPPKKLKGDKRELHRLKEQNKENSTRGMR